MDIEVHGLLDYYYDEDKETIYKCAYTISRDGKIFAIYTLNNSNEIYTSKKIRSLLSIIVNLSYIPNMEIHTDLLQVYIIVKTKY